MRLVYLHQYFNTRQDPGGSRSYEFARRLVAEGHTVHMITSRRSGAHASGVWEESDVDGIRVHRVTVPYSNAMPYWDRIRAFVQFAWHSGRLAARLDSDVVFATSTPLTIALPAVYAARKRRVPMVLEIRDLWPELPIAIGALRGPVAIWIARELERFAYRNAALVIALSPGMRQGIVATGYPPERVSVIPNAADVDLFGVPAEQGRRYRHSLSIDDRPLVVYAGTLGKINGVGYLARIAARAQAKGSSLAFLVAGSGRERQAIEREAESLGVLGTSFYLIEPLPKSDMPLLLSAADVAVSLFVDLPEMWNNSANKFFDALASGTPVAINYQGWQAELLEESGAGIVLPAADADGAADLLIALAADRDRLRRAGAAALRLAETRFDRAILYRDFRQVLETAVSDFPHGVRRRRLGRRISV